MATSAYALLFLNIKEKPPRAESVGIFLEDSVTMNLAKYRSVVVIQSNGRFASIDAAIENIIAQLDQPWNAWMLPLLGERDTLLLTEYQRSKR